MRVILLISFEIFYDRLCLELDVCVYLMSAVAVQMEVEEGANATVTELLVMYLLLQTRPSHVTSSLFSPLCWRRRSWACPE